LVSSSSAARAIQVDTRLSCPASVNVGETVPIDVVIENEECAAVDVRLSTGFVANSSAQNLGSTAIHGPKVAASVELEPGDCVFPTAPSTLTLDDLPAQPPFPAALAGKVAVLVLVTEWSGGAETDTCLLMPEPAATLQLAAGVLGLGLVRGVGQRGARPRSERRR
jgi:hypothetical protein